MWKAQQNATYPKFYGKMLADIVTTFTIMLNVSYLCRSNSFINKIKVKYKKLKVQLLEMGGGARSGWEQ